MTNAGPAPNAPVARRRIVSSLGWILLSGQAYKDIYHLDPARAVVPFSQPGLVTIPLGFVVLVVVSLLTQKREAGR